jgi:hypothetical protein
LWNPIELNEPNIFENGILEAFNITRAGGNAPLFDRIFNGLTVTNVGVVNGTTLTGSQALRRFTTTNQWIANGDVANFANWLNSTSALTGANGGLLRNAALPENFIVVNPQFGSVALHGNNDNSIYHALQTEVKKRLSSGFTGQFSYTWSKNLGNSAGGNGSASSSTATTRDPRNRNLQRGLIVFDRTHQFKANGTWVLPFGANQRFLNSAPRWRGCRERRLHLRRLSERSASAPPPTRRISPARCPKAPGRSKWATDSSSTSRICGRRLRLRRTSAEIRHCRAVSRIRPSLMPPEIRSCETPNRELPATWR